MCPWAPIWSTLGTHVDQMSAHGHKISTSATSPSTQPPWTTIEAAKILLCSIDTDSKDQQLATSEVSLYLIAQAFGASKMLRSKQLLQFTSRRPPPNSLFDCRDDQQSVKFEKTSLSTQCSLSAVWTLPPTEDYAARMNRNCSCCILTKTCPNQDVLIDRFLLLWTHFYQFGHFMSTIRQLGCLDSDMFLSIRTLCPCIGMNHIARTTYPSK